MPFPHEKLSVYRKALDFFGEMQPPISSWGTRHAFVDHLSRATDSILFNLVEAVRLRQKGKKMLSLDYAVGSTLECAACLDIAALKGLGEEAGAVASKERLLEICKMLIGLRNSWDAQRVAEGEAPYTSAVRPSEETITFGHERLDMYAVALDFYRWFIAAETGEGLGSAFERSIDVLATRVALNIAEGNGRYAELSRRTFLETANGAAAKLAVAIDMGMRRGLWSAAEGEDGKRLLVRIGEMTASKNYAP